MADSYALPDRLPARLPARHPDLEVAAFPSAIVVFDVRNRMAHELVGTPAAVFDACSERVETSSVIVELVAGGVGDPVEARALVASVLTDLANLGLLEGCEAPTPPPCIECGAGQMERRRGPWWWRR